MSEKRADERPEETESAQMTVPSPATPSLLEQFTSGYPEWAQDFARKYFTKTLNQFILYGNVRDLVPGGEEGNEYVSLRDFLVDDLFAARDIVLFYDRSSGIHFADKESQKDFNRALSGYDTIFGTDYARKLPKDPVRVLAVLQNYFRIRLADGKRIACIIDYAETIIPMAEASAYSTDDRNSLVFLRKWAHDPLFLESDFTMILVADNLSEINQQVVQSAYTAEIKIPLPDEAARKKYVDWFLTDREGEFTRSSEVPASGLAVNSAGLGYIQLQTILADVLENRTYLSYEVLSEQKKEFIEAEAHGMLAFVESDWNLDMVAGHTEAKAHLRQAARALKAGRGDVLPMGYLVSGPVGTGKTFTITCFAGEIGIPMVMLKNFRSQWQGQTEANLERILGLLEAMTPVAVMIDEADAALGNRRFRCVEARFRADRRLHERSHAPREDHLFPRNRSSRFCACRPQEAGSRRGAHRPVLPFQARGARGVVACHAPPHLGGRGHGSGTRVPTERRPNTERCGYGSPPDPGQV